MKLIDVMQMYVNKEVLPKKIIIHDYQVFDEDTIWEHKHNTFYCREYNGDIQFLFEYIVPEMLNDEVEIIEDTNKNSILDSFNNSKSFNEMLIPINETIIGYCEEQKQEIKAVKEVAAGYLKENIKLKEENERLKEKLKSSKETKKLEKLNLDRDKLRGKETPRAIDYLLESKINGIIEVINERNI